MLHRPRGIAVFVPFVVAMFGAPGTLGAQTEPQDSIRGLLRQAGGLLGSQQSMSAVVALSSIEVSTAPLGTSTGGFTFTFDPLLRINRRAAASFGPAFAQRSLTTGRGRVSVGANWLHASYDSLGDQGLRDGSFTPSKNVRSVVVPFSSTSLNLELSSDTVVGFAQVGLTDDWDVGVTVPWVRIRMEAEGRYLTASGSVVGDPVVVAPVSAAGVGDVAVFTKYRFWKQVDGGLAAALDIRLPTGDKNQLRGLDVTRTLVSLIWSKGGRISPHANAGYEAWSGSVPISADGTVGAKNQLRYAFGVEMDVHPQLTAVVDVVGRRILKGGKLGYQSFTGSAGTLDALVGLSEGIDSIALAPGAKWNVWRNMLVTGSLLATLSNAGLRANLIPVVGVDWAF